MKESFKKELTSLLNRYGWDNTCETPDHILADYVEMSLKNYSEIMCQNIDWHSSWERLGEEPMNGDIRKHQGHRQIYLADSKEWVNFDPIKE